MDAKQLLILLVITGIAALLAYSFRRLLIVSQNCEDADDEALWHYLLTYTC